MNKWPTHGSRSCHRARGGAPGPARAPAGRHRPRHPADTPDGRSRLDPVRGRTGARLPGQRLRADQPAHRRRGDPRFQRPCEPRAGGPGRLRLHHAQDRPELLADRARTAPGPAEPRTSRWSAAISTSCSWCTPRTTGPCASWCSPSSSRSRRSSRPGPCWSSRRRTSTRTTEGPGRKGPGPPRRQPAVSRPSATRRRPGGRRCRRSAAAPPPCPGAAGTTPPAS